MNNNEAQFCKNEAKNGKKYPISVVIVAKNEADNLKRCLGSLCEWVEEIIVVINDCTDDCAGREGGLLGTRGQ